MPTIFTHVRRPFRFDVVDGAHNLHAHFNLILRKAYNSYLVLIQYTFCSALNITDKVYKNSFIIIKFTSYKNFALIIGVDL